MRVISLNKGKMYLKYLFDLKTCKYLPWFSVAGLRCNHSFATEEPNLCI